MENNKTYVINKIQSFIDSYSGVLFPGCVAGCANSKQQFFLSSGTQDGVNKIDRSNIFDIASVTKLALNMLTLKKIPLNELDQKVCEVFKMKGRFRDQITVRHLLTFGIEMGDQVKLSKITKKGELTLLIENSDLIVPPGSTYRYTNLTSMILTLFLQRKFDKSFELLIKEDFLDPLNLVSTGFNASILRPNSSEIIPTELQIARGVIQDESAKLYDNPTGSAGLFSNVQDLLRIGQSFLGDNTYLDKDVISLMPVSQFENAAMTFGLGMGLRHQNECDLVNDDGTPVIVLKKNGFSGVHFCVMPENDFCFVVFGNICYPKRPNAEGRDQFTLFHKKLLRIFYENRNLLL